MRGNGAAATEDGPPHPLVDHVVAALRELSAAPQAQNAATAAIDDVARTWLGKRYVVGLTGDDPAIRAQFINHVCGSELLDPQGRPADGPILHIRRAAVARVRGVSDDGSTNDAAIAVDSYDAEHLAAHTADLREFIEAKRSEAESLDRSLPAIVRVRPPLWAIWLWPVRWIRTLLARRTIAARDRALAVVAEPQRELARVKAQHAQVAGAPEQIAKAIHRLSTTRGIRAIHISVVDSKLPSDLELVELVAKARAPVDAGIIVEAGGVHTLTGSGVTMRLGDFDAALAALPALARHGRALRIGKRYQTKIASALTGLDDALQHKEASFGERLDRLAQLRLVDPKAFVATQLQQVLPHIVVSIQSVMEHGAAHLGVELAELSSRWLGSIAAATARPDLSRAVAAIESSWTAELQRIAKSIRILVDGGVRGAACDLYPYVVEPLRAHGLPNEYDTLRAAPSTSGLALLAGLHDAPVPKLRGNAIANLVRSFPATQRLVHERLRERIETLTNAANAQMLSSEPVLHQTLSTMIANELQVAIGHQVEWLARAESDEQSAIAAERAELAPLVVVRDAVYRELEQIARVITQLERDPLGGERRSAKTM